MADKRLASDYPAPVRQLFTYGDATDSIHNQLQGWPNYLQLGLTEAHSPALIQVLQSRSWEWELDEPEEEEYVAFWASIHAWRALGQLRAEAAIPELLRLIVLCTARSAIEESEQIILSNDWIQDWIGEELPLVLGLIGPPALPPLQELITQQLQEFRNTTSPDIYGFTTALDALQEIATGCRRFPNTKLGVPLPPANPAAASEILELLHAWLQPYAEQDPEINAWFISTFLDIQKRLPTEPALLVDAPILKVIEKAFADERVDHQICGDWEDLQLELGLLTFEQLSAEKQAQVKRQERRERLFRKEWAARKRTMKQAEKIGFGSSTQSPQKKKKTKKRR
ncbi:MAG: hypothetical protein SNJ85_03705 [Cyanobacteriota bacterium]